VVEASFADLMQRMARELQGVPCGREQAAALAPELERLNEAVLSEAPVLGFEVEPVHFLALLEARGQ
jgi:hypothetical protein